MHNLLGVVDELVDVVLEVLDGGTSLVATLGDNLGVVGGTTTVPGQKLERVSIWYCKFIVGSRLTLGVSEGISDRAPEVATEMRASLSFLGVIFSTAKAESSEGWRET